jgi:hypothetical protein
MAFNPALRWVFFWKRRNGYGLLVESELQIASDMACKEISTTAGIGRTSGQGI